MTDDRLRELERRWAETGASEAEEAWLRERERCGLAPFVRVFALTHRLVEVPKGSRLFSWRLRPNTSSCEPSWEDLERCLAEAGQSAPVILDLTAYRVQEMKLFVADTFGPNGPRSSMMRRLLDIQERHSIRLVTLVLPGVCLFPADWGDGLTRFDSVDAALRANGWAGREWRTVAIRVGVPRYGDA